MSEYDPGELNPDTKALIAAVRDMHEPTPNEQARVFRGLEVKLAAGVVATSFASSALAASAKVLVGVVTIGALSIGTWQVLKPESRNHERSIPVAAREEASPPEAPLSGAQDAAVETAEAALEEAPGMEPRRRRRVRRREATLSQETALLRDVNGAINRGEGARALALLDQYDRRFKSGTLKPERSAARVLALCLAGRRSAAEAEAARFVARWPRSPLMARLNDSCARTAAPRDVQ